MRSGSVALLAVALLLLCCLASAGRQSTSSTSSSSSSTSSSSSSSSSSSDEIVVSSSTESRQEASESEEAESTGGSDEAAHSPSSYSEEETDEDTDEESSEESSEEETEEEESSEEEAEESSQEEGEEEEDEEDEGLEVPVEQTFYHVVNATGRFFVLSDIHLDLLYDASQPTNVFCRSAAQVAALGYAHDCGTDDDDDDVSHKNFLSHGQPGCDAPLALLNRTLEAMAEVDAEPDFILLLGDYAAHCQASAATISEAVVAVTEAIAARFPGTMVLPAVGNNELYPHNQVPLGHTQLMRQHAATFGPWLAQVSPTATEDFAWGGYYAAEPVAGLRVLVLNTAYYSVKWCASNVTVCDDDDLDDQELQEDPQGQFRWLEAQLRDAEARSLRVMLAAHISPSRSRSFKDLWHQQYEERFGDILRVHSEVLEGLFCGHTHRDGYGMLLVGDEVERQNYVTVFVHSSMTPRDDNNPTFRLVEADVPSGRLRDYVQYSLDMHAVLHDHSPAAVAWQEGYRFTEAYGLPSVAKEHMLALLRAMREEEELFDQWLLNWGSHSETVPYHKHSKTEFLCGIASWTNDDYEVCTKIKGQARGAAGSDDDDGW